MRRNQTRSGRWQDDAVCWYAGWLIALLLAGCGRPDGAPDLQEFSFGGPVMGTSYHIKVVLPGDGELPEGLSAGVHERLERVNALMSTYRSDSEVSRFNAAEGPVWMDCSAETAAVVAEALELGRMTDGSLDITVGPLVDLWHFGSGGGDADDSVPSPEQIEAVRPVIGLDAIDVRMDPPALFKRASGVRIDLSAIAKGYAVDRAAEYLLERGVGHFMIEVGGEIRVHGLSARGGRWNIAVEQPLPGLRRSQRVLSLSDLAVATSGDYRNYFEVDGRRYSHIIDPGTGRPIEHALASVTVLSSSCMRADGLATAMLVLGPDRGWELALEHDWAVYFLIRDAQGWEQRSSAAFERMLSAED
ncbi:MAG: FAD:protein FMN transferase [Verrucomicrobiota bacterium]|jgi:thiamine biosynthesis lipoprotein